MICVNRGAPSYDTRLQCLDRVQQLPAVARPDAATAAATAYVCKGGGDLGTIEILVI
jgi:hypothetical protein